MKGLSHNNAAAFFIPRIKSYKQEAHISSRDRLRLGHSLTVLSSRFVTLRSLRTEASYVPFRKSAFFLYNFCFLFHVWCLLRLPYSSLKKE